jgi:transposase
MCLKTQPPWPMPAETAAVGEVLLKEDSPSRLTGDKLFEHLCAADFADLYSTEGKPGISPAILAFVTVFQFMEKLPRPSGGGSIANVLGLEVCLAFAPDLCGI